MPLDETIDPGQEGHIADHEAIASALNTYANWFRALGINDPVTGRRIGSAIGATSNGVIANGADNRLVFTPIPVWHTVTVVSIQVDCRNAAGSGGFVRIGLYDSGENGRPRTLLGGSSAQISATSPGDKVHTFTPSALTLAPGLYWGAACTQGGASPKGNFQIHSNINTYQQRIQGQDSDTESVNSLIQNGVSGALPDTAGSTLGSTAEIPASMTMIQA